MVARGPTRASGFQVDGGRNLAGQASLVPARVALWAEEHGSLIVVEPVYGATMAPVHPKDPGSLVDIHS